MAERIAAQLTKLLGEDAVTSHHGSLSRERRLDAEERLKAGRLRALVATASLELGIDIGDVDLVIQVGATRSIATFLQRVGRSGHALAQDAQGPALPAHPRRAGRGGRAAALRARTASSTARPRRRAALDILAQQVVAACVPEEWRRGAQLLDDGTPGLALPRPRPAKTSTRWCASTAEGRRALLHRDGVQRPAARDQARAHGRAALRRRHPRHRGLPGAPGAGGHAGGHGQRGLGHRVQRRRHLPARQHVVADPARRDRESCAWPTPRASRRRLPFWLGEAPGRTRELAAEIAVLREEAAETTTRPRRSSRPRADPLCPRAPRSRSPSTSRPDARRWAPSPRSSGWCWSASSTRAAACSSWCTRPSGRRSTAPGAWPCARSSASASGSSCRRPPTKKRSCSRLGPQHSFELERGLRVPAAGHGARDVLIQALLAAPMFETRWRWNAQRSLLLERSRNGKKVPAALLRMRADDLLARRLPAGAGLPGDAARRPHRSARWTTRSCARRSRTA